LPTGHINISGITRRKKNIRSFDRIVPEGKLSISKMNEGLGQNVICLVKMLTLASATSGTHNITGTMMILR